MDLLVIGADVAQTADLEGRLAARGHRVSGAVPDEGLELVRTRQVDVVLLPWTEPETELLERVRDLAPELPVIVVGERDAASAAEAASARGAFGYVPVDADGSLTRGGVESVTKLVDRAAARARVEAARSQAFEESLRERRFYEAVLTSVAQGILVVDLHGKIRFVNPEAARLLGEEDGPDALSSEAAVPLLQMLVETLAERKAQTMMLAVEGEEEKLFLYVTTSILRDTDGRTSGAIAIVSDRSAEKRLEEQLVHSERLATLGGLLASIAHEITNTLTSITGCAEMGLEVAEAAEEAARAVEAGEEDAPAALRRMGNEIRDIFDMVLQAGMSAQTIANNMLQYSRQGTPGATLRQDMNRLLEQTLKLLGKHVGTDKVKLELDLVEQTPWVRVEPAKVQQAMVNLIVNAIHALQEMPQERRNLRLETRVDRDAGRATISVIDTGPGIPPRRLERIWKPFFTTKGHGTGLGLHITRTVVSDQGGTIECESEVGKGTRFTISLPLE